jgi:cytoskeleton protein RodZ
MSVTDNDVLNEHETGSTTAAPQAATAARAVISSPEELIATRLEAQMSRETLAARLNVGPNKLGALETGGWDSLPSLAFARALARAAGKELNADATGLVNAIGGFGQPSNLSGLIHPMPAKPVATTSLFETRNLRTRASQGGFWRVALPVAACGVAGFLALALVLSGPSQKVGSEVADSRFIQVPVPGAGSSVAVVKPSESVVGATRPAIRTTAIRPTSIAAAAPAGHVKKVAVSAAQLNAGLVAKEPAKEPGALTFPVQMPDSEPIELTFSQVAWVDIRHKDGEKLLFGKQKAMKSMVLNAVTPVQVVIGNPDGVKMWFRGEAVDLSKKTRKGVSRFELK